LNAIQIAFSRRRSGQSVPHDGVQYGSAGNDGSLRVSCADELCRQSVGHYAVRLNLDWVSTYWMKLSPASADDGGCVHWLFWMTLAYPANIKGSRSAVS